jgi:hypothetical protein
VTHNLLIGWLVSQALDAPPWRWMGLNQMNCAVTIIAYLPGLPAGLGPSRRLSYLREPLMEPLRLEPAGCLGVA